MQNQGQLHSARSDDHQTADRDGTLSIGEVSALLAVPAPTIRSWERRHGINTNTKDRRGHRRYTADDVAVLRRMRDERASGRRAANAAVVATAAPPSVLSGQLLDATHRLDGESVAAVLDFSLAAHGLRVTLEEVLLPSMREVGARWSRGECDVAEEHLTSAAVLAWLAQRAAEAPPPLQDHPVVLGCGPEDQHTIALDALTVLLRHSRFDCRNLGARTPAASLRTAVDQCAAGAVVLVCQLPANRPAAVSALRGVSDSGAAVFYAGAAFSSSASRRGMPGHYLDGSLSHAVARIAHHLRPDSPGTTRT